jgi:hypothetical protein
MSFLDCYTTRSNTQVDQFGNCHAPFATARALLNEHGLSSVKALVHDSTGVLHAVTAAALVPSIADYVNPDDFDTSDSSSSSSSSNSSSSSTTTSCGCHT